MSREFSLQMRGQQRFSGDTRAWAPGFRYLATCFLYLTFVGADIQALEFKGQWQQGGMLIGTVAAGDSVDFDGRSLPVSEEGQFVLGLGRNAPSRVTLRVNSKQGEKSYEFNVAQREYAIQRIEGVPQRTVTPPESVMERIRSEGAEVSRARRGESQRLDFLNGFSRPLEGPITGVYGSQRVYNGVPKNPHYGLDIAGPEGAMVYAPNSGVVKLVHRDMYYSGGTLIIDHGYGVSSTFIHLSDILVSEGAEIKRGDPIAKVGATGRATGPHLDWRVNWYQVRLDPAQVLEHFSNSEQVAGADGESVQIKPR